MADRGRAFVLLHQLFGGHRMIQPEHLGDAADILVRVDQLIPFRMVGRHARGKLPPILDVQQQPGDPARTARRPCDGQSWLALGTGR